MKSINRKIAIGIVAAMLMATLLPVGGPVAGGPDGLMASYGLRAASAEAAESPGASTDVALRQLFTLLRFVWRNFTQGTHTIEDEEIPLSGPEQQALPAEVPAVQEEQADAPVGEAAYEAPVEQEMAQGVQGSEETSEPVTVQAAEVLEAEPAPPEPTEAPAATEPPSEAAPTPAPTESAEGAETYTVVVEEEPVVEHAVLFVGSENEPILTVWVAHGEAVAQPGETPVLEGHAFRYWYDADADPTPYAFGAPVQKSMTLKPVFALEENEAAAPAATEAPEAARPEAGPSLEDVNDALAQGKYDVVDVIKGENGLEVLIVKDTAGAGDSAESAGDALPEGEAAEAPEAPAAEPSVEIQYSYVSSNEKGTFALGSTITVTAVLNGFPEGAELVYQWQNNAGGEYADVPGATGLSYSFVADKSNTGCAWRISITMVEAGEAVGR